MAIYGRETVRYKLSIANHTENSFNAIQNGTTDWELNDTFLDGSDNTKIVIDNDHPVTVDMVYESKGSKNVRAITDFDDGWGNIYKHKTEINVTTLVYEEPVLDFIWYPFEPTIVDEVTFTQDHDDIRDEDVNKQFGRIDEVRVDYYNDNVYEEDFILKEDETIYQFTVKKDNIEIRYNITYWDGWEHQTAEIIKSLNMSNIPPVSDWEREDNGVCIPSFDWTATSTDLDDNDEDLVYSWKLYQQTDAVNDLWNLVDTASGKAYNYPFQYEGHYKIDLTTTDTEGLTNSKVEAFDVTFGDCTAGENSGSCELGGEIQLQNGFQLIAIPTVYGSFDVTTGEIVLDQTKAKVKNYLLDQLAYLLGIEYSGIGDHIESCVAVRGGELSQNFVSNVTPETSINNFELAYEDDTSVEFTAFYVNVKTTVDSLPKIKWKYYNGL